MDGLEYQSFVEVKKKKDFIEDILSKRIWNRIDPNFLSALGNAHCVTITTATMQVATRSPQIGLDGRGAQPSDARPRHALPSIIQISTRPPPTGHHSSPTPCPVPFHCDPSFACKARPQREGGDRAHRHPHQATRGKKRKSRASARRGGGRRRGGPCPAVALSTL